MARASLVGLLALLLPAAVAAQEVDWKRGRLAHLAPHIGTYRYEEVLADPEVAAARLAENLQVRAPIDFIGGHLVLRGLAPHRGGEEEATVWIKLYDGEVRAALLHDGRLTLFAREREFAYLPRELRAFLRQRERYDEDATLPAGVAWIGRER